MQTIDSVKLFTTAQAAELLGCDDGYIRKLKSEHSEELEGLHHRDGVYTLWQEEGIKKLAEWVKTPQAIALRTKVEISPITVRKKTDISQAENHITVQETEIQVKETQIESENVEPFDYTGFEDLLADKLADKVISKDFKRKTDAAIVKKITKELSERQTNLEASVKDVFALLDAIAI